MEDYIGNYEAFGKDGYYVIPKDKYELIQRVLDVYKRQPMMTPPISSGVRTVI